MPSLTASPSMGLDSRMRVPLKTKLAYRFYGPIILLKALNSKCERQPSMTSDSSSDTTQSPENTFHCFVNILGQLCDSDKGGSTVTAFVVLQHPDHIEYRFASNQRDTGDLILAKDFTISILQILNSMQGHEKHSVISSILQRSLAFGRPRVTLELNTLQSRTEECISACKMETTEESGLILQKLEELYQKVLLSNREGLNDDEFTKDCEILVHSIHSLRQSEVHELISNRAKEGRMDESEKWSEFRHLAGRLVAYLRAAKALVLMPKKWPELFDQPRVCYVPSSVPDVCPFRGKRGLDKVTANEVIGFMTSNSRMQERYRACAQELQGVGLDRAMKMHADRQTLRPIVHAEVLVHQSLETDGGTHPSRFFNGYKYIGCSKPSCILCHYYFERHSSGVKVRPTHHNLYPSWRMPDIYEDQGPEVEEDRKSLIDEVLKLIRRDTFRTLTERRGIGKRHDTNTSSWYPKDSASVGTLSIMEDLTVDFRNLSVQHPHYEDKLSSITEISSLDEDEDYFSC